MSMVMVPSLLLTKTHVIRVPPGQRNQGSGLNPGSLMSILLVRGCIKGGPTFLSQAPYPLPHHLSVGPLALHHP